MTSAASRRWPVAWERLERLLPRSPRGAFFYGFLLSLTIAWTISTVLPGTVGTSLKFGGSGHDGYWELATNLIRGNGYVIEPGGPPVLHRPPMVPCLYAPLTLLPAVLQRTALVLLHSLMVGATCWLLFDLATRICGTAAARLSVGLLLVCPTLYFHTKNPMCVITQMFLVSVIVNLLSRELAQGLRPGERETRVPWPVRALFVGLCAGTAILTHGTMLLAVPVLLACVMAVGLFYRKGRLMVIPVLAGCMAILVIAPWTWRNWTVNHRFVPVTTNAGLAYFWGIAHWQPGKPETPEVELNRALQLGGINQPHEEVLVYAGIPDPDLNAAIDQRMKAHVRQHPFQFAAKIVFNAAEYYFPSVHDLLKGRATPSRTTTMCYYAEHALTSLCNGLLWGLAFVGLWRNRHAPTRLPLAGLVVAVFALAFAYWPFLVVVGHNSYAMSTIPFLAALAASGLVTVSPRASADRPAPYTNNLRGPSFGPTGRTRLAPADSLRS